MPQLDFQNVLTVSQVVWMALIFGALYVLLARWALPQVATVLESRDARITADLDTARLAKVQADAAVVEVHAATRRASTEAQTAIAAAVAHAKADSAEQARTADERLDTQLAEAERRIADARKAAMAALRDVATETTAAVVSRLTGQPADPASVNAAIGTVMAVQG